MQSDGADRLLAHMTSVASRARENPDLPVPRPRDAATLIVLDRSRRSPKVLMGRRHPNQRFMPGKYVFPGGAVEMSDRRMPVVGALSARTEDALMKRVRRPSPQQCRSLALSAIRETFEETGLMLGTRQYGAPQAPAGSIWQQFEQAGVFPVIEELSFVARAITPPGHVRRFDTRFFLVDRRAIAEERGGFIGPDSELTELVWVPLRETAALDLATITGTILDELRQRIDGGLSQLLPVPFYHVRYGKAVRETL